MVIFKVLIDTPVSSGVENFSISIKDDIKDHMIFRLYSI
jgi:hypothetical protein